MGSIIIGCACLIVGGAITWIILNTLLKTKSKSIIENAEKEAESIKKDKLLEVKEKFIGLKADLEKQVSARNSKIQSQEAKLRQRELILNQKQEELNKKKQEATVVKENLDIQLEVVEKKKQEIGRAHV